MVIFIQYLAIIIRIKMTLKLFQFKLLKIIKHIILNIRFLDCADRYLSEKFSKINIIHIVPQPKARTDWNTYVHNTRPLYM